MDPRPAWGLEVPERHGIPAVDGKGQNDVRLGALLAGRASTVFEEMHLLDAIVVLEQTKWKRGAPKVHMFLLGEVAVVTQANELENIVQCEVGAMPTKPTSLLHFGFSSGPLAARDCKQGLVGTQTRGFPTRGELSSCVPL